MKAAIFWPSVCVIDVINMAAMCGSVPLWPSPDGVNWSCTEPTTAGCACDPACCIGQRQQRSQFWCRLHASSVSFSLVSLLRLLLSFLVFLSLSFCFSVFLFVSQSFLLPSSVSFVSQSFFLSSSLSFVSQSFLLFLSLSFFQPFFLFLSLSFYLSVFFNSLFCP